MFSDQKEQIKPIAPTCETVMKKIMETTKQQLSSDGWWTEPEQKRVNVASGEDCLVC